MSTLFSRLPLCVLAIIFATLALSCKIEHITNTTVIDGGAFWKEINGPLDARGMAVEGSGNLAVSNSNALFVTSWTADSDGYQSGGAVYRTTNDGGAWTNVSSSFTTETGDYPVVFTSQTGDVYAIMLTKNTRLEIPPPHAARLYVSSDDGTHWTQTTLPATLQTTYLDFSCITNSHGSLFFYDTTHVYRSDDRGMSWTTLSAIPPAGTAICRVIVTPGDLIFAALMHGGLLRSTDDGVTWDSVGSGLPMHDAHGLISILTMAGNANGVEFASLQGSTANGNPPGYGVYRSTDRGSTWTPSSNNGLANYDVVWSMISDGDNQIFANAARQVYRSRDNGLSWSAVTDPGDYYGPICLSPNGFLYTNCNPASGYPAYFFYRSILPIR